MKQGSKQVVKKEVIVESSEDKSFLLKHDMFAFILIISVKTRQKSSLHVQQLSQYIETTFHREP